MGTVVKKGFEDLDWHRIVMVSLGFWLSACFVIDGVILPSLMRSGMMLVDGFASAGYQLFSIFNRIELLCAAIVLTSIFIFTRRHCLGLSKEKSAIIFGFLLLGIALIDTYLFTPQMSALGLPLSFFPSATGAEAMDTFHFGYIVLEGVKLSTGLVLLQWFSHSSCALPE